MPKPTQEELYRINKFTQVPLSEEDVYVFHNMMIDDQLTSYNSKISPSLLNKFMSDTNRGVGLLLNHNSKQLPVGRSFDSELTTEFTEDGEYRTSLYGKFYIDLGRNTQGGMTTDDIAKGIDSGTIFDTSIGFSASKWSCSICNHDIRDYTSCSHMPGEKYAVTREGQDLVETCHVIVGDDGEGELLENSLVYAGACNRATIIKDTFSMDSVSVNDIGTKLHIVEDFKNLPLDCTVYQYYTKDGSVLFTDTEKRTNGSLELKKRSEQRMELQKFLDVLGQFGIEISSDEELSTVLQQLKQSETELSEKATELDSLKEEFSKTTEELTSLQDALSQKEEIISELVKSNEELSQKAGLADTYREDLIKETLEFGVRAHGNSFNTELFEKFLVSLSVEEIKTAKTGFEKEVQEKFANARVSEPDGSATRKQFEPTSKEDFSDEVEFRNYVAEKAVEYAKENKVSISDATKIMMKKYSSKGSE